MVNADWKFLEALMPMGADEFLRTYWERRYVRCLADEVPGSASISQALFSFELLDQILSASGPRFADFIRISQGGHSVPRDSYSSLRSDGLVDFDTERVIDLYADGATITVNRAHQSSDELARFCIGLANEFSAHVNANVYATPPNSQGFSVHSDTHDVILMQVAGRKRWKLQRRLEYLATREYPNVESDAIGETDWDEFLLEPGDVLYIPRGLLHEGISGDSHSLHVTIGIHSYTWGDLVRDLLSESEKANTVLREAVLQSDDTDRARRLIVHLLSDSLHGAEKVQSVALQRTSSYREPTMRGRFRRLAEQSQLTIDTPVRSRGMKVQLTHSDGELLLVAGAKSLIFPDYVLEHLRIVFGGDAVTARALPPDLDDEGRLVLVKRLVSEGLVSVDAVIK